MTIRLDNVAKRYGRETIFKQFSYAFHSGRSYAILGPNGSGKSTLLMILAGFVTPNKGEITYIDADNKCVSIEQIYRYINIVAPYLELIEEFTLREQIRFHGNFRSFLIGFSSQRIIELLGFEGQENKEIRNFSSGMKQRLKLSLCVLSDAPILLMDEPLMNLDQQGRQWFQQLVQKYAGNRLVIVCSNRKEEYDFCDEQVDVTHFK